MSEAKIEPGIIAPAAEEDMAVPGPDGHAEAEDTVATVKETSFDAVITRVLDASDVANKTASIAANSTEHLLMGVEELRESTAKARTHAVVVLGVTGFLMLASVGVFTLMALQLQDRLVSADATVLAVGKRVVALNSSIGTLKEMEKVLEKFNERQEGQSSVIEKLMPRVDTGLAEVRKAVADLAEKSAKQAHVAVPPDPRIAVLQSQLKVIESQLQLQARATAKQAELSAAMQASLAKMNATAQNLEALLKLEKQRVVAAVPVAAATQAPPPMAKEKAERARPNYIQYPTAPSREPRKDGAESSAATP